MEVKVSELNAALEALEVSRGISKETALESLKEAMTKGLKRDIGDDEARVEVNIDPDKGLIEMFQIKTVVKDEEDDPLLEISLADAKKINKDIKVGEDCYIPAEVKDLRKAIVLSIKSMLKQKFAEAEKEQLYEQFKDKIGTMITGRVEQIDERGASINIGKTSIYMQRKEMIKDEKFLPGDTIKVFVSSVESNSKGARIVISRACEGFLTSLMGEEIHDIYDGTIQIKAAAREAGERSKVAVYSEDPNIDPAGTCIGPNGSRIQKVVSQLGNGSQKEKVDIISYSNNPALFIMEALKPAKVVGVKVDEENKSAVVVVKDDSLSLAIGRKGVNARLAVKLTGYNIDIKVETEALEAGIEYVSFEEISALALEERAARIAQAQREALVYQNSDVLPGVPDGYVAPQARQYEEESNDFDSALEEALDKEEVVAPEVEEKVEEVALEVEEVAPALEEPAPEVEEKVEEVEVKTTTTLEDLEKSLSDSKKETNKKSNASKRKKKVEEEEEKDVKLHSDSPRMSIYTEEELREMEEEENDESYDEDEDDIDYDEYDEYYDEN